MIKVAQLGAGRMGAIHARNAAANPRLDLVALVDPRPDVAGPLAQALGARLARFEEVLADPDIKGIIVASSTDAHLDNALSALRAGKIVFCEKPLDLDLARLLAASGELDKADGKLFVAFNRRFDPHYQALKAKIDSGEIGKLESLHIVNHDPAAPPPAFIPTSGGLFKDFTIHDFDLAPWLMGERPVEVFAWASCLIDPEIGRLGDVDTAKVVLTTASGRLCMISNSRRSGYGYDQRIEAFGSRGAARVDNLTNTAVSVWGQTGALADRFPYAFIDRYAGAYAAEMDHFADILEGKAAPETGFAASVASLELAEAAARSATTGAPVRL
ncbi:inositol 2-dehydrogenase [Caulobacter sp. Root487D2Y]|jgi:myo-inositol 2-dehydrogenase/D-chiro-inositol 1-dehydrogenase|uniref:inositol 2-dehydrogenase n=1 Tax=Caulobacter sp. Root487D2Y TaxID=1736547 RepID=UPI0006FBF137|nr:inositol 2-dehydrogenase [Caulobacter sp. Root487D2Y]KQY26450.1 inositol 2-dehydrogenase [Caulobacter sp. Root487D2Y]